MSAPYRMADMALTRKDVFSVAQALYWYCADYHGGQWSPEYAVLSKLAYHPGRMEHCVCRDDSTASSLYDDLANGLFDVEDVLTWIEEHSSND